ncbi:MAG: type II toxin-antitoxin system VapC family toxin [Pseudomonadota bacterium]|nr:type II toxin-antitoxin system VapC family toxin [Pseudomonadota bacterium]
MIALDTNILARYLLKDDADQFERARILIEGAERITAPVTVLLELAWVLEISDCSRQDVTRAFRLLAGLPNFTIRPLDGLLYALRWYEEGMGFADALHLAMSAQDEALATFDRDFAKIAKRAGAFPEVRAA